MNSPIQPTPSPVDAWDDARVTAYVFDELSNTDRAEFESAMKQSADLRRAVEEARAVADQLGVHFTCQPSESLSHASREAILDSTRVSVAGESTPTSPRKLSGWLKLAVAVGIAFVLVGLMLPANRAARRVGQVTSRFSSDATENPVSLSELDADDGPLDEDPGAIELRYQAEDVSSEELDFVDEQGVAVSKPAPASGSMLQAWQEERLEARLAEMEEEVAQIEFVPTAGAQSQKTLDRRKMEISRRRVERSQLLETNPNSNSPPDIAVSPVTANASKAAVPAETSTAMPGGVRRNEAKSKRLKEAPAEGAFAGATPLLSKDPLAGGGRQVSPADAFMMGMDAEMELGDMEMLMDMDMDMDLGMGMDGMMMGGMGPGMAGDRYEPIEENDFQRVDEHPLSTFSIDVDTASYSKVRASLLQQSRLPRPAAVRIEELVNYFDYQYDAPEENAEHPFAANMAVSSCPWNTEHRLLRVGIQAKTLSKEERPRCNLVFLIDTSGSMQAANKLSLVIDGMKTLTKNLRPDDQVAIVVYAGSAGLVLESTPASKRKRINRALTELKAGGSTNGGQGIQLAYEVARSNFIKEGVNRVILCSDGDFNVGVTGTDQLVELARGNAKTGVDLTVLGFGMGNHNDAMMERVSNDAEGNYAYVDSIFEARKVLADQLVGTLVTVAKDVKIQMEFNPRIVGSYRLIGYENRLLAKEDFNDDTKDAGEIGAGHRVTALYELVPTGQSPDSIAPPVDELRYGSRDSTLAEEVEDADDPRWEESLALKIRYKQPQGDTSTRITYPLVDSGESFENTDPELKFAASVAAFGMKLRRSRHAGSWTLKDVQRTAIEAMGEDVHGLRQEFVVLVSRAMQLGAGR
ncbi:MAG: VWA domain-containing protein [Planctomycetota bacterium]